MEKLNRIKRLRNATLANLGLVTVSLVAFGLTGNEAYISEIIHDGADTGNHGSRFLSEKFSVDQDTKIFKRFLKTGMLMASLLSGYTAYRLGLEIRAGNIPHDNFNKNLINLLGATTIAGGNTYAYQQVNSLHEHSNASMASLNHAQVDMTASWGLASSITLESAGVDGASTWGGLLFASYTAGHLAIHALKPHREC